MAKKKEKLSQEKKKEWNEDLNFNYVLYYIALTMGDYSLMNLQSNPQVAYGRKSSVNKFRRWFQQRIKEVEGSAKQSNMTASFKMQDDENTDRIATAATICHMIFQMPVNQLEFIEDAFEMICQNGIDKYFKDKIEKKELTHHIWMLDGKLEKFVHNYSGKIEHLLSNAIKEFGQDITMKQFMAYCRKERVVCCRVSF